MTFLVAFEVGVNLCFVEIFVRGIVNDVLHILDAVLGQI